MLTSLLIQFGVHKRTHVANHVRVPSIIAISLGSSFGQSFELHAFPILITFPKYTPRHRSILERHFLSIHKEELIRIYLAYPWPLATPFSRLSSIKNIAKSD